MAKASSEPAPTLERPVTKSLLGGKKTKETNRPPPPFTVGDGQQVSLGFVTEDEIEYVFPWMFVGPAARQGEQLQLAAGDFEATILLDYKKAEKQGWQIAELMAAIHAQTLAWLHHRPEEGITVRLALKEKDDGE